jgi:hypothetical protein
MVCRHEAGQHGGGLLQAQAVHRLAHRLHGLAHGVQRAVGVAQQGGGHGHVAAGDARHLLQVGSGWAMAACKLQQQGRAGRYDDLAQRAALAQFIQFFGDVRTAHRQAGYLSHGLGHRECQLLRPRRCKVEP